MCGIIPTGGGIVASSMSKGERDKGGKGEMCCKWLNLKENSSCV